jgi:hypothetical protein
MASTAGLKFDAWCFSGAWCLELGAFAKVSLEFGVWSLELSAPVLSIGQHRFSC